jgi:hypothetical protein
MLASFLGVLPILTPPLCALAFIMCSLWLLDKVFNIICKDSEVSYWLLPHSSFLLSLCTLCFGHNGFCVLPGTHQMCTFYNCCFPAWATLPLSLQITTYFSLIKSHLPTFISSNFYSYIFLTVSCPHFYLR